MPRTTEFMLTQDHLDLLSHLVTTGGLSERFPGAPEFDGKRPYGNEDHLADIVEIVYGPPGGETSEDRHITAEVRQALQTTHAEQLHGEIATAFAVVWAVLTRSGILDNVEPGLYDQSDHRVGWQRA